MFLKAYHVLGRVAQKKPDLMREGGPLRQTSPEVIQQSGNIPAGIACLRQKLPDLRLSQLQGQPVGAVHQEEDASLAVAKYFKADAPFCKKKHIAADGVLEIMEARPGTLKK